MKHIFCCFLLLSIAITGCQSGGLADNAPEISRSELMFDHNREREINGGLGVLKEDEELNNRAQNWAEHMAKSGSLYHSSLNMKGTSYALMGENIAKGFDTPEEVIKGWMNSPGHRRNILEKKYTHAGFGVARDTRGKIWWCVQFAGN